MFSLFIKCEVAEVKQFTVVKALARRRVVDASLGPRHSCVIVEPGHVFTFGCNSDGQLGTGNTRSQTVPIEVKYFQQNPALVRQLSVFAETYLYMPAALVHVLN